MLVYVRKKEIHLREMSGSAAETGPLAALGLGSSARDVVLAVDGVRHAQAVAWDSASDSIFWSDFKATTISRARRDGSQQRVVVATDLGEWSARPAYVPQGRGSTLKNTSVYTLKFFFKILLFFFKELATTTTTAPPCWK